MSDETYTRKVMRGGKTCEVELRPIRRDEAVQRQADRDAETAVAEMAAAAIDNAEED